MVDDICYSVQCKDEESCKPVEISHPNIKESLAFISRGFGQPTKPTIGIFIFFISAAKTKAKYYEPPGAGFPKTGLLVLVNKTVLITSTFFLHSKICTFSR